MVENFVFRAGVLMLEQRYMGHWSHYLFPSLRLHTV
jgi:hypothetical protein